MLSQLRPALILLVALHLLTGIVYPLVVTGAAQMAWHDKANGSVVSIGGKARGSRLIGQPFSDPRYFWGRPSATAPVPYNGGGSVGSNLGPTNPALVDVVRARVSALRQADPSASGAVPVDLVTTSGSGLDPHISFAAALYQAPRVARARGLTLERVRQIVGDHSEGRAFMLLGEPRVNVLLLNLALDEVR
jgi:potassium-transporting ATPase KdpC subunit